MSDHLAALATAAGVTRRPAEPRAAFRMRVIECVSIMPKARWLALTAELQDFYNAEAERVNQLAAEEASQSMQSRTSVAPPLTARQRGAPSVTARVYELMCLNAELTPVQAADLLIKEGFPRPSMSLLHTVRCQTKLMLRIMTANGRLATAQA